MVESTAAYRRLTEDRIAHGFDECFASRLKDRVALGAEAFVERMRGMCAENSEYEAQRMLRHRIGWGAIVEAVEQAKGRPWSEFAFKRGDWGRAAVYYLARQYGGLTLSEIGDIAGGVKYHAVSKLLKRFETRLRSEAELKAVLSEIHGRLNV
jgi:hypothetical protein